MIGYRLLCLKRPYSNTHTLCTVAALPGIVGSALMGHAAADRRWLLAGLLFAASALLFLLGFLFRSRVQTLLERISGRRRRH